MAKTFDPEIVKSVVARWGNGEARVSGSYSRTDGLPMSVEAYMVVPTLEDAKDLAGRFPKSVKVHGTTLGTWEADGEHIEVGYVAWRAQLISNGVNGGVNETGLKRARAFAKHCERLGIAINFDYDPHFSNHLDADQLREIFTGER